MKEDQRERLIKLAEECGELVQLIMKTLQFGYEEHYPEDIHNNRKRLELEIRDVLFWIRMMHDKDDINLNDIEELIDSKYDKAMKYTQHQKDSTWKP